MSNTKSMKRMLDESHVISSAYNERATNLSNRLISFEKWLQTNEFRAASEVMFCPLKNCKLLYSNIYDSNWSLNVEARGEFGKYEHIGKLVNCSIDIKAEAVKVLPELLSKLIGEQLKALSIIDAAHSALDELAKNVGSFEEEAE